MGCKPIDIGQVVVALHLQPREHNCSKCREDCSEVHVEVRPFNKKDRCDESGSLGKY